MSTSIIRPIEAARLRAVVRAAKPFPFCAIDDFLQEDVALEIAASFPPFEDAARIGRGFDAVNERRKIQITDATAFPAPIRRLHEALASPAWLETLSTVMDIPALIADPELVGGGIHETGPHGHLDVHVDFNYLASRQLHRRLNILVYFNPGWNPDWGGQLELWDPEVRTCHHEFAPLHNRCIVFETSEVSFHGVRALTGPPDVVRRSFAGYYYTREAPPQWSGQPHSTVFRARPRERVKGLLLMPAERVAGRVRQGVERLRRKVVGE